MQSEPASFVGTSSDFSGQTDRDEATAPDAARAPRKAPGMPPGKRAAAPDHKGRLLAATLLALACALLPLRASAANLVVSNLSGSGGVVGALTNSGVLAPTNIAVSGGLVQNPDGLLRIALANAGSGRLVVTGAATLGGGLEIAVDAGFTATGQSFEFLAATDGLGGTFDTVSVTGGAFTANLTKTANGGVTLTPAASR